LRQSFSPTRALGWTGCRGVFYAPPIDHYVISRYAEVEAIFRDPGSFSAAPAQLPLVDVVPEGGGDPARRRASAAAVDG
jgi:hypothetical protein